ncbi:Rtf2 RING-finger-domain-containing protein [Cantharellus anzutake]|uniref:Rtf2 RING-finger-domain-containing protein n=1 Tax=Cantharellus anzutake TaxID=1750568 RepID=UPI0019060B77|nr:Rtf2 RING-finger-domain-containing protein [Cantharellus anzutake]KAF8330344.1 Rtf2 RING-finger-domain-containing protein [Cantharellus anzutake]
MGNDGGSIPDRRDLVKSKPKAEQADKNNRMIAQWFFCALSKRELQDPIVSCELGKLYNKDAILEYLLDRSAYGDGEKICGHIRSLKDVKTLTLTKNPVEPPNDGKDTNTRHPKFICPLTLKEMTGAVPFCYVATCGDVFSSAGLRSISTSSKDTPSPPPSDAVSSAPSVPISSPLDLCPQCGTKFTKATDIRLINPSPEVAERLREEMIARRAAAKPKGKKRKAGAEGVEATTEKENGDSAKRAKQNGGNDSPAPSMNPSLASINRKVAADLAEEEKKRKEKMSSAVASLYGDPKEKNNSKETFLTMGTFTRYA